MMRHKCYTTKICFIPSSIVQVCFVCSQVVRRYDPRLDRWIEVASMQEPRADFVAVAYGNHIYAFGGRNRQGVLDTCERYDPKSNSWSYVAKLPEVRWLLFTFDEWSLYSLS